MKDDPNEDDNEFCKHGYEYKVLQVIDLQELSRTLNYYGGIGYRVVPFRDIGSAFVMERQLDYDLLPDKGAEEDKL